MTHTHIVIEHLNTQGLKSTDFSKCNDILHDNQIQKVHVLCLTETHCTMRYWFSGNDMNMNNSYDIYRPDRNGHCGDVVVCVNTKPGQKRLHRAKTFIEIVGVKICTPHTINILH